MKVTKHPLAADIGHLRHIPADEPLIRRLEASHQRIEASGRSLPETFYGILFTDHPGLRSLFPPDMADQKKKFALTLTLVIENLRSPHAVRRRLEQLGVEHVGYHAQESHYPLVCDALVTAIGRIDDSHWSDELRSDWVGALRLISEIMIAAAKAGEAAR